MSIFGKIKGAKKAAEQHKAHAASTSDDTPKPVPYVHRPTHAAIDALTGAPSTWKAEDRAQIKIQNEARLSRSGSSYSARSSRTNLNRTSSSLSADWNTSSQQPRSSASSLKSHSRNASYQGLAKVLEDSHFGHGEPVPAIPLQYSSAPAVVSRPKAVRSPFSAGSSIGRSPLSSEESSHVDSEESSNASASSSSSNEGLEMRSKPTNYPAQNVFDQLHKNPNRKVGETTLINGTEAKPERKYFTHKTTDSSDNAPTQPASTAMPAKKRARFSFMKKEDNAVVAH